MYPVTAPANSCAIPSDRHESTGKQIQARRDFKVVGKEQSNAEFRRSLRKIDPGKLASKILQLHAAADRTDDTSLEKPSLADDPNDGPFEIPGVLRKKDDTEKISDVVSRSAQKNPRTPLRKGRQVSGQRFRTVIAGTLLAGVAGGAALAFGLPDMMIADEPATRPVSTELIVAEPPLAVAAEQTVSVGGSSPSGQESAATAQPFNTATPQQISEAKDRLRLAFASGNTGISQPLASAAAVSAAPVYPQAAPDQAAIAEAVPNTAVLLSSPSAGLTIPAYARPATADTQSERPVARVEEAVAANNSPDTALDEATAGPVAAEAGPGQDIGAYPHSGQTTAAVNMRLTEKKNSEIIAVIPGNTTVSFSECGKWWCGVEFEGKTGFVGQRFVKRTPQ